jgi:FtsP/CotA-like multicopper oxidase with cupredoxin domain
MRVTRRSFIARGAGTALAGSALAGSFDARAAAGPPDTIGADSRRMEMLRASSAGMRHPPVVTPNGWTLPFRRNGAWKEFHLAAEPVARELAPGLVAHLSGYNGQSPGPTIECLEGDRLRIVVSNALAEPTTIAWNGLPVPYGMSGFGQSIAPGQSFVFSFEMTRSGTFLYRPQWDDKAQAATGLFGAIVVHARDAAQHRVDRDFLLLANSHALEAPREAPRIGTPTWTLNGRAAPGLDALAVRAGDRVRIRAANLAPAPLALIMHGHAFAVTGTGGGWVPDAARWPETAIELPAGSLRVLEFTAAQDGDWPLQFLPAQAGPGAGIAALIKVRASLAAGDYRDPGPYVPPDGNRAQAVPVPLHDAPRPRAHSPRGRHVEVKVVPPRGRA